MNCRQIALLGLLAAFGAACASDPSDSAPPNDAAGIVAEVGASRASLGANSSGTAVLLSDWKWRDVTGSMQALKDAGYTALQLAPHTATCSGAFGGRGFDPSDFASFDGGFGTERELAQLIGKAHDIGLQVYASMVMNHMCTHGDYQYARFGSNDFHRNGGISDFNNQYQLENNDLVGLNDLAQESGYVRGELFNYLVKTNNMGFDGYRWDAAKHVPLWFWRDHVLNNVNAWGKYSFGEVFNGNPDYLQGYVNTGMAVTDFSLYFAMKNAFTFGGDLTTLDGAGFAARNGARALTFVENQDVDAPSNRYLAYAFIAGYPGYPMFANVDTRDSNLNNLAFIHNSKAFGSYLSRWKERDVLIFERQGNLVVGINQSGSWQSRWIDTSWSGTKLHDYTGHTSDVYTSQDRRVLVSIPPTGWVMLSP